MVRNAKILAKNRQAGQFLRKLGSWWFWVAEHAWFFFEIFKSKMAMAKLRLTCFMSKIGIGAQWRGLQFPDFPTFKKSTFGHNLALRDHSAARWRRRININSRSRMRRCSKRHAKPSLASLPIGRIKSFCHRHRTVHRWPDSDGYDLWQWNSFSRPHQHSLTS